MAWEDTALNEEPRKQCSAITVGVMTPFSLMLSSPSQCYQAAVEDIFLLIYFSPSCLSVLLFLISEHTRGSRLSLIHFHLTPLESLQERAKRPKMQKCMGTLWFGSLQPASGLATSPFQISASQSCHASPCSRSFTTTDRRNFMNLKKKQPEFLSLPGGEQQQTHQRQIFLSALIISQDASYHEEKGIKPGI